METLAHTEIIRLKPEKDDSDTQSAVNYAIGQGTEKITILGATGNRIDHLMANFGLLMLGRSRSVKYHSCGCSITICVWSRAERSLREKNSSVNMYLSFR